MLFGLYWYEIWRRKNYTPKKVEIQICQPKNLKSRNWNKIVMASITCSYFL